MYKTSTIACPKCHAKNSITLMPGQSGYIICQQCAHHFKVIPKAKAQTKQTAAPEPLPSAPPQTPVMEKDNSSLSSLITFLDQAVSDKKNSSVKPALNSLLNQAAHKENHQNASEPLTKSAGPSSNSDAQSQRHLHSSAPSSSTPASTPAVVAPQAENTATAAENVNNLNNLVFTLLPNADVQHQADVPLLLNDAIEKTDAIYAKTQYLHNQQDKLSKEFNWTLASLVALTVLMMQLFYLMAVK